MSLELIVNPGHRTGLQAVCDVCGKTVRNGEANICWTPLDGPEPIGYSYPYRIACKARCTWQLDHQYGHQYTQELDTGIYYLVHNARIDMKRAKECAEMLALLP